MGQQAQGRHQLCHQRACQTSTSTWTSSTDTTQASTQIPQWNKGLHHPSQTSNAVKNSKWVDSTEHHNIQ
eukprot:2373268-Amphidinium_carterae.1